LGREWPARFKQSGFTARICSLCLPAISRYSTRQFISRPYKITRGIFSLRAAKVAVFIFALSLLLSVSIGRAPLQVAVNSAPSGVSTLYVSPQPFINESVSTGKVTIGVFLNLTLGESFNEFDVRLDYSNYGYGSVLLGSGISYFNNVFGSSGNSPTVDCIDGIPQPPSSVCPPGDGLGKIELSQSVLGTVIPGPRRCFLFNATFSVRNPGSSVFTFEQVYLYNPGSDPANPRVTLVPYVGLGGVFGNSGVVAFYNYYPAFPPAIASAPAILSGNPVVFDASGSFDASNPPTDPITSYKWVWGDSTTNTTSSPTMTHTFQAPGNYSVQLAASSQNGGKANLTRTIIVLPHLGSLNLLVLDQMGTELRGGNPSSGALVQIFNSSSSSKSFENQTTDFAAHVEFNNLVPGVYYVRISGHNIVTGNGQQEEVFAGWPTLDTIYVTVTYPPPPPPDYSGLIYLASTGAALAVISGLLFRKKRKSGKTVVAPARERGKKNNGR